MVLTPARSGLARSGVTRSGYPILKGVKARTFALSGVARSGATRSNYHSSKVFVTIDGVHVAFGRADDTTGILDTSLTITDGLTDTPTTAACIVRGFTPRVGADVVITLGSKNNLVREFGGTVLNARQYYVAGKRAHVLTALALIDYTWGLRAKVSAKFTSTTVLVIATALIAYAPGYTLDVAAELAVQPIDEITFTETALAECFKRLVTRAGAEYSCDYHRVVRLFDEDTSGTAPTIVNAIHPSAADLVWTRDLSQIATQVNVEGGGTNALTEIPPGETILPVESASWYDPLGGFVLSGPQRIRYTGIQAADGGGSLIGPSIAPTVRPLLTPQVGSGLGVGEYHGAYTFVTAGGETLPSPLRSVNTLPAHTVADPSTAPPAWNQFDSPSNTTGLPPFVGDVVEYAYSYTTSASNDLLHETNLSPANPPLTVELGAYGFPKGVSGYAWAGSGALPGDVTGAHVWRRRNGGSWQVLQVGGVPVRLTGSTGNYFQDIGYADSGVTPPTANATVAALCQLAVAGIAIGPTGTTARNVYRTARQDFQLKLQQTIANNTATVGVVDATPDGSLGANAPTVDTSGLSAGTGRVLAGADEILTAGVAPFAAAGGWARAGQQLIRYTGISGNLLTGIPVSGVGAISTTLNYGDPLGPAPALTGIPANGAGSIRYPIRQGDPVNLWIPCQGPLAASTLVVGLGDSLTFGYVAEVPYTTRLQTLLGGAPWVVTNHGVSGADTANMLSRLQAAVIDPGAAYMILLGGINDIAGADLPLATIQANLSAMYAAADAAGVIVVAVTCWPFGLAANWNSTRQGELEALNAWIRSVPPHVDVVIDGYAAMGEPGAPTQLATAYDRGDGLHANAAGYAHFGDVVYAGVIWQAHHTIARAAAVQLGGDGVIEDAIQDRRLSFTEARARGEARLAVLGALDAQGQLGAITVTYKSHDINTRAGRTVTVYLGPPTNLQGDFLIQRATLSQFQVPHLNPTYDVDASSVRFSETELLRLLREKDT